VWPEKLLLGPSGRIPRYNAEVSALEAVDIRRARAASVRLSAADNQCKADFGRITLDARSIRAAPRHGD
jgi:hypothetical protein